MKASTLQSFLEECRAAKTSDEIGAVVEQIEQRIATMRATRASVEGQLQEAIVAGRDPGKIHTAIAQMDQDLMTLEAARGGFSQKQEETRQLEFNSATQALIDQHALEAQEVAAAANEFADYVAKARASGAKLAEATKRHDRIGTQLEARKARPGLPASSIIRNTIGEVPRGDGVTEYGRRIDITLEGVLTDNPSIMRRAQILRRGRFGESNQARDTATEGWVNLAKNIDKAAG